MGRLKTLNEFIIEANNKHNDFYDYSKTVYVTALEYIKIICPIHGLFKQTPNEHLKGYRCSKCAGNNIILSLDYIINQGNVIHNNKYDYSLIEYKNNKKKVKIICPVHGVWEQTINDHLGGHGCGKCDTFKRSKVEGKLYYKLVEIFGNNIISQGRPDWLGRQRFDMYFPTI